MDPSDCFSYLSLVLSMRFNILALSAFLFFLSAAVSHCSLYRSAIKWPLWLTDLLNLLKVFSIGSSSLQISLTAMFSFVAVNRQLWSASDYFGMILWIFDEFNQYIPSKCSRMKLPDSARVGALRVNAEAHARTSARTRATACMVSRFRRL